jgi:hypothetical protein
VATFRVGHKPEYLSMVFYFASVPKAVAELMRSIQKLLEGISSSRARLKLAAPYEAAVWAKKRKQSAFNFGRLAESNDGGLCVYAFNRRASLAGPLEFLWSVDWDAKPVSNGIAFEPLLNVTIGVDFLEPMAASKLRSLFESLSVAATRAGSICHGLADIANSEETGSGNLYGGAEPAVVPFERRVHRLIWVRSGERRKMRLRGLFWGQVLSAGMLKRLGGGKSFAAKYAELDDPVDRDLTRTLPDGSLVVLLTKDPLGMTRANRQLLLGPPTFDRGAWLYERLRAAELL